MKQKLSFLDVFAIGFMTFAFFLGAGNVIFPPLAGQLAGGNYMYAMLGFLVTAVGLPLAGIVAVAISGGNWEALTKDLPKPVATTIAVLIFIVIGPAFAEPRVCTAAYEMGIKPLLSPEIENGLPIFSIIFFGLTLYFSWFSGKLIDYIGKVLTPVLFVALIVLGVTVLVNPQGAVVAAQGDYASFPLIKGLLEGYNTMDTLASLMFGMLIVDIIKRKGITEGKATCKYLIYAGLIAASGLAFVYVSLFYLGATSSSIAAGSANGGVILSKYIFALFGSAGQYFLTLIVGLACLTTAVGITSAFADYMNRLTKIKYRIWVIAEVIACTLVANVGLTKLIALSIPVLLALYPVAIALVMLAFMRPFMGQPRVTYMLSCAVAFVLAMVDVAMYLGCDLKGLDFLPLFDKGMAWLIPTVVTLVVTSLVLPNAKRN